MVSRMCAIKSCSLQLCPLYCQLLLLTCFGTWELGVRRANGQPEDCSNILRATETALSILQPCVTSSTGAPIVLDGSRRFESASARTRDTLNFAFKSSTVLLLPPRAVTEIVSADITGVRLAKPATVMVQLLLTVSVQPTAVLLLEDVFLETDCATVIRYQQWISEAEPANMSVVEPSGDVFIQSWTWRQAGIRLTNCTITCLRPPVTWASGPPGVAAGSTIVHVSSDLDLYNALALATSYGNGSVTLQVGQSLAMTSPLWTSPGVILQRNISIVGLEDSSSSGGDDGDGSMHPTDRLAVSKPVVDLQDVVSGVFLADGVVLSLTNLTFVNTGMVFGYAPVPYTGLGFVSAFLWFFDFRRVVFTTNKPMIQLVVVDCDIISYQYDVVHLWAWATFLTTNVEPILSQAAPFRVGVYDIRMSKEHQPALEFTILDAYSMLYLNTGLLPDSNSSVNVTLTARGPGEPLYTLNIPIATSAVAVWTLSDLQNVLALAQRSPCSPFSNTTTYIHIFANISLDQTKWPNAGYNLSCNVTISGSVNKEGGTWLNFNLLARFVSLAEGAMLTLRYLTLFNMPSQLRSYSLGDLTQMTLPMWPVDRPPGTALLLIGCTVVLPAEEYRMLADVASGRYSWSELNSSIKIDYISPHSMTVMFVSSFSMLLSNTLITDSSGNVAYTALLGPNIYGTAEASLLPPAPQMTAARKAPRTNTVAVAAAVSVAVVVLAAVLVAVLVLMRIRHSRSRRAVNAESSPGEPNSPGAEPMSPAPPGGSKSMEVVEATPSSNNTPQSEDASALMGSRPGDRGSSLIKASGSDSDAVIAVLPLHVELHQLILDFAREIEDQHLTIHDALGSGGFATVYRGTWRGIDVAVKVIEFQDRAAGNERLQARAMTEAAIAANIQHANVVTTYSYDIRPVMQNDASQDTPSSTLLGIGPSPEGGRPVGGGPVHPRRRSGSSDNSSGSHVPRTWKLYLIQEFCEVGSLRMALENRMFHYQDGQPNLPMVLRLMLDVVRGLHHLHKKNIVHGDLTPGNILLKCNVSRPGQYVAKLADFGLSVKMNPSQTSVDNNRTGTPFYASPEVRQHGNLTKASDLYALGVVLWEMWHGRPCYQRVRGIKHYIHASGYPSFPPHCPVAYSDLVERCLRRALEERPQLDDVNKVLRSLLGSAVSGISSGSEGGTSGSPSHEWPFVFNNAGGLAALDPSTAADGGSGGMAGTAVGNSTGTYLPPPLATGLQAAVPPPVVALVRAGSGQSAAVGPACPPVPGHNRVQGGCGGARVAGGGEAAAGGSWLRGAPQAHGAAAAAAGGGIAQQDAISPSAIAMAHRSQRQRLWPFGEAGGLNGAAQEDGTGTTPWAARAGGAAMPRLAALTPLQPTPAALLQGPGSIDGGSGGNQVQVQVQEQQRQGQPAASGIDAAAGGQPPLAGAHDAQLDAYVGDVHGSSGIDPSMPMGTSISLRLGTTDDHFVTALGSNG